MKRPNQEEMEEVQVDMLDLPYDFDSLMAAGTMSGHAIIVMDDSVDIVEALANVAFYAHESCGQCRLSKGSLWMSKALHRLVRGRKKRRR